MWSIPRILLSATILLDTALTAAVPSRANSSPATFKTVQTVPDTRTLENLAIRHTGDLLVTSTRSNVLHQVSPHNNTPPIIIANISDALGLLGIAELQRDVFFVAASRISASGSVAPGSNRVWKIDMRSFKASGNGTVICPAEVSLAAQFPDAKLLNGMSRLSWNDDAHLLIADSQAGNIVKFNVFTGNHSIFASDPTMAPLSTGLNIGINGIHVRDGIVYYTSLDQGLLASLEISPTTGLVAGSAQILGSGIVAGDDFALSPDGRKAYIANNGEFTITEVDIPSRVTRIAANSSYLETASSVVYAGRDCGDYRSLYYVTGALSLSSNETVGRVAQACLLN